MEGEVNNFIWVWTTIFLSLFFCHTVIGKNIPKGTTRLLTLIPIISLFLYLPLNLITMQLGGFTYFFISWLANFKLLLFAYGKGPLSNPSNPSLPIPLSQFIPISCLPIKISNNPSSVTARVREPGSVTNSTRTVPEKGNISPLNYAAKATIFCISLAIFDESFNPYLKMGFYCFHIYFILEITIAMLATVTKALCRVELEPQFDEPYLATSVQDFWGRRWNLMASSILRPTVYFPVKNISTRLGIPKKWAPLPAVFVTFLVSGLMHELIFYYIGRSKPTGEVTCFFIIHGVSLDIEIVIKKALDGKFRLNPIVSRILVLGFVLGTSFWLFLPPFLRFKPEVRACQEFVALRKFVRHGELFSPYDTACPSNFLSF